MSRLKISKGCLRNIHEILTTVKEMFVYYTHRTTACWNTSVHFIHREYRL